MIYKYTYVFTAMYICISAGFMKLAKTFQKLINYVINIFLCSTPNYCVCKDKFEITMNTQLYLNILPPTNCPMIMLMFVQTFNLSCASTVLCTLNINLFNPLNTLCSRYYLSLVLFTEKTVRASNEMICVASHGWRTAEPGHSPGIAAA